MCVFFKSRGVIVALFLLYLNLYIVFFFKEGQEWLGWNTSQALIVVFISSHSCLLFLFCHEKNSGYPFCSFSKSRISARSFSSWVGSGALGASAGFSASFLAVTLFTTLMSRNTQKATMRKSRVVWRKLP